MAEPPEPNPYAPPQGALAPPGQRSGEPPLRRARWIRVLGAGMAAVGACGAGLSGAAGISLAWEATGPALPVGLIVALGALSAVIIAAGLGLRSLRPAALGPASLVLALPVGLVPLLGLDPALLGVGAWGLWLLWSAPGRAALRPGFVAPAPNVGERLADMLAGALVAPVAVAVVLALAAASGGG